ncbi:hypothetical protein LCGC14_3097970, partial [marine sediment metagenome]
ANDLSVGGNITAEGDILLDGSFIRYDSVGGPGYWHEHDLPATSFSKGASGATEVAPDANTLGGWQLNANTEYLYTEVHGEDDIVAASAGRLIVTFEVNVDNTGGLTSDVVVFDTECYRKVLGETVNTVHTHSGSTVVGQAGVGKLFKQEITLHDIDVDQTTAIRLSLDTAGSDVDDVILVLVEFAYKTFYPAEEVD